jgi:dephospho-CoA kinase
MRRSDYSTFFILHFIVITGGGCAGKTTAANIIKTALESVHIESEILSLATPIKEAIPQEINQTKEDWRTALIAYGYKMKALHGNNYFARLVNEKSMKINDKIILVDDLRFLAEEEYFRRNTDCKIIKIDASYKIRLSRMKDPEKYGEMAADDPSENEWKKIEEDEIILNNASKIIFEEEVKRVLETIFNEK